MKYKVKYKTGWRDIGYDSEVETVVIARDFDEAVHTANRHRWNSDVCAKIVAIEEIEDDETEHRKEPQVTVDHNCQPGDTSKLRKALDRTHYLLADYYNTGTADKAMLKLMDVVEDAMSSPSRNCDNGTPEQQSERFLKFCDSKTSCSQCPLSGISNAECAILWANMQYETKEKGEE